MWIDRRKLKATNASTLGSLIPVRVSLSLVSGVQQEDNLLYTCSGCAESRSRHMLFSSLSFEDMKEAHGFNFNCEHLE